MTLTPVQFPVQLPVRLMVWAAILAGLLLPFAFPVPGAAQDGAGVISGSVVDTDGTPVLGATVTLLRNGQRAAETVSSSNGEFVFNGPLNDRYEVEVLAEGLQSGRAGPILLNVSTRLLIRLSPALTLQSYAAGGSASDLAQPDGGAALAAIEKLILDRMAQRDVLDALRIVPGVQTLQSSRGAFASIFVRGGAADFNKVTIDGVTANDVGGAFDMSALTASGSDRLEVLRLPGSLISGQGALAGVVNLTTRRGRVQTPGVTYQVEKGDFHTLRQAASIGGAIGRFDYFTEFSHFATANHLPNNKFQNGALAGRFGWLLNNTDISTTVRRTRTGYGSPGPFNYFMVADDAYETGRNTLAGIAARSEWTDRISTTVRLGFTRRNHHHIDPLPTGTASGPNHLGHLVTIKGGNGFTAQGRAILDGPGPYPQIAEVETTRWALQGHVNYVVGNSLSLAAGMRAERLDGFAETGARFAAERVQSGFFVEARTRFRRLYVSAGAGFENYRVFATEVAPRLSAAFYLRRGSPGAALGDTKLTFNAAGGIKEPGLLDALFSLDTLLQSQPEIAPAMNVAIRPIGPERSRSFDAGVEQTFWSGRALARAVFFRNDYADIVSPVGRHELERLGFSTETMLQAPFGAAVNALSYRTRGLEASAEAVVSRRIRVAASYLLLDALVTQSTSDGIVEPAINPAFPGIPIGAFAPLPGGRPFRMPTHSGSLMVSHATAFSHLAVIAYFSSRYDDSTYLLDQASGTSLLLPNRHLGRAYQRVDVSASYRLTRRIRTHLTGENILDHFYDSPIGSPAQTIRFKVGLTLTFGSDLQ